MTAHRFRSLVGIASFLLGKYGDYFSVAAVAASDLSGYGHAMSFVEGRRHRKRCAAGSEAILGATE